MPTHNFIGLAQRGMFLLSNQLSPSARARHKDLNALRSRFYHQFWQQSADHIGAELQSIEHDWTVVKKNGNSTFLKNERVMLDSAVTLELAGNKALIYRLLAEDGYQVPKSLVFTLDTVNKALEFQLEVDGDVVIKPMSSWGGRGVTVNINNADTLKKAAKYASKFGNKLLIEQHIHGASYRLLFLNGELIDAVRRDSPTVTGDGTHTIKQLIDIENNRRLNAKKIIALSTIVIDSDCKRTLKAQDLSLDSVLSSGQLITIKTVVNHNNSSENHVVKDQVHKDIKSQGRKICLQYQIELAGLDIITSDITKPLSDTGGVVNEINTTPGLHHHSLVSEQNMTTAVGALVLDYILSKQP